MRVGNSRAKKLERGKVLNWRASIEIGGDGPSELGGSVVHLRESVFACGRS